MTHKLVGLLVIFTLLLAGPAWRTPAQAEGEATTIFVPSQMTLQNAINSVVNNGIIEIAAGTYTAPANGFNFGNLGKSFTVRAAPGATVVLSGGNSTQVLRFQNGSVSGNGTVTFDGLTFANGYSNVEGIAAGATLYKAQAAFNNCTFRDNVAVVSTTVGGGIYVADSSTVSFSNCVWQNNSSRAGGAGLGIRTNSVVTVSNSQFLYNKANPPNHTLYPTGGGINMGNSTLTVSNTRFEGNEAGAHGGAIEVVGNWQTPYSTPRATAVISNSTFINNRAIPDPSVSQSLPNEGGAISIEDQSLVQITDSRFITNSAMIGGAITLYRGTLTVARSQFLGNKVNGSAISNGFGGAISATGGDSQADGSNNRPVAQLTIDNSYFQGRYGSVTTTAFTGGCLHSYGDGYRVATPDNDGIPNMGTVAQNQNQVTIRDTVFNDCDVQAPGTDSGVGGAVSGGLTNYTIQNSLFMKSDAFGSGQWGSGGAIAVFDRTALNITSTSFSKNTANRLGAAVFAQGSDINISGSQFFENEITPGVNEPVSQSYGAAIFTGVDEYRGLPATGIVQNNVFSNNVGLDIFDDDRVSPINATIYNSNQFYASDMSGKVYGDSLNCCHDVAGLNSVVVSRSGGPSTDKSTANNSALGSAPILGKILAIAPTLLPLMATGDTGAPTAYVCYAWSGASATLNGNSVSGNAGSLGTSTGGTYTLNVGGTQFSTQISQLQPRIFIPLLVR